MELNKACIINAAYGSWYPQGQKRLVESLRHNGFAGDILTWANEPINEYFDPNCLYTIKAAALAEAMRRGYTHILWLDCSIWTIGEVNSFFDKINEFGYYFLRSGYNCAQTSNDFSLNHFDITRDEAEKMEEVWSCIFGIDLNNPIAKVWAESFLSASKSGVFNGSRLHDGGSNDERFLFHRQDQTAASLAFHKLGMSGLHSPEVDMSYHADGKEYAPTVKFLMRGL